MDILKLTRPVIRCPAVTRLQELGDYLGVNYGENDGIFGRDTEKVVRDLQRLLGLPVSGVCDGPTWQAILKAAEDKAEGAETEIADRRGQHPNPKLYAGTRQWSQIAGVTLHQTGCHGMSDKAGAWDRLNAHIGVTPAGRIILVNDPTDMIWHAQGLSRRTLGIEVAGNYYGVEGRPSTLWRGGGGPSVLTEGQIAGLARLFDWLKSEFAAQGAKWTCVNAHRQSAADRPGDPGSAIWKRIGLPWQAALGATDGGPTWKTGDGRVIPRDWNPAYTGAY